MSNPLLHAYNLGRATAEILSEGIEHQFTDLMSTVGQFDAEQRERLRDFTQQVMDRAQTADTTSPYSETQTGADRSESDIQAILDELRAEIAQLRSTLQRYRQS